nr:DUF1616 domain-containing protein [uncultured Methanobacterium sp.]
MEFDRTISIIIIIALIIGTIGIFYVMLTPAKSDGFTEFYLLGADGKAGNYPTNLTTGEKGNVTIGVVNHEYSNSTYLIQIKRNSTLLEQKNISLQNGEKKEIPLQLTVNSPGEYKFEFNLYKLPDTKNIYRSVFLLVNVS